jgi:hypothetical protein
MRNFVRDATVHISITFVDKDEKIVNPDSANVTLSYVPIGQYSTGDCQRSFTTYPMAPTPGGNDWFLDWDSSISAAVVVHGHAVTTTIGQPVSSVDFQFRLTANRANKELAGDEVYGGGPYG